MFLDDVRPVSNAVVAIGLLATFEPLGFSPPSNSRGSIGAPRSIELEATASSPLPISKPTRDLACSMSSCRSISNVRMSPDGEPEKTVSSSNATAKIGRWSTARNSGAFCTCLKYVSSMPARPAMAERPTMPPAPLIECAPRPITASTSRSTLPAFRSCNPDAIDAACSPASARKRSIIGSSDSKRW